MITLCGSTSFLSLLSLQGHNIRPLLLLCFSFLGFFFLTCDQKKSQKLDAAAATKYTALLFPTSLHLGFS
jgi:hypothetical protein